MDRDSGSGLWQGAGDRFIWHWGDNPGFKAFIIASTRTGHGIGILTSSDYGLELAEAIAVGVLPDTDDVFRLCLLRKGLSHLICLSVFFLTQSGHSQAPPLLADTQVKRPHRQTRGPNHLRHSKNAQSWFAE